MIERDLLSVPFIDVYGFFETGGSKAQPAVRTHYPTASTVHDWMGREFRTAPDYHVRSLNYTAEQLKYVKFAMFLLNRLIIGKMFHGEDEITTKPFSQKVEDTFINRIYAQENPLFGAVANYSLLTLLSDYEQEYPNMMPALYSSFRDAGYSSLSSTRLEPAEYPKYLQYALRDELTDKTVKDFLGKLPREIFIGTHSNSGGMFGWNRDWETQCSGYTFTLILNYQEMLAAVNLGRLLLVKDRYYASEQDELSVHDEFPIQLEFHMRRLMGRSLRRYLQADRGFLSDIRGRLYSEVWEFVK